MAVPMDNPTEFLPLALNFLFDDDKVITQKLN